MRERRRGRANTSGRCPRELPQTPDMLVVLTTGERRDGSARNRHAAYIGRISSAVDMCLHTVFTLVFFVPDAL